MFHLLRIHFVDFSFSFCFCVSWLLPEGMLPSVSPESAGLLCALWSDDKKTCHMTQQFNFFFALCSSSHRKLGNLALYRFSMGLWQMTVTQIPSHALYCHLSPSVARPCLTLGFFRGGEMIWQLSDSHISRNCPLPCSLHRFGCWLTFHVEACRH